LKFLAFNALVHSVTGDTKCETQNAKHCLLAASNYGLPYAVCIQLLVFYMSHTRHLILAHTVNCISPLGTGICPRGLGRGRRGGITTVLFCWRKQSNVLLKFEPDLSCLSVCLSVLGLMGSSTGMNSALFLGHKHKSSFYFLL